MAKIKRKTQQDGTATYFFWCVACQCCHHYQVGSKSGPNWTFNANYASPTFAPSLRLRYQRPGDAGSPTQWVTKCHLFVRAGHIQYCGDCPHNLKGQTVPMQDIPEQYGLPDGTEAV